MVKQEVEKHIQCVVLKIGSKEELFQELLLNYLIIYNLVLKYNQIYTFLIFKFITKIDMIY